MAWSKPRSTTAPRSESPEPRETKPRGDLSHEDAQRALAVWREHDGGHALHALDRAAMRAADAPRALILEHLARPDLPRDLYNACARFGRLLAEAGASPSLMSATLDGAEAALSELGRPCDPARIAPARASIAEGYFAAVVEGERAAALRAWDYPRCAVKVGKDVYAIAAACPTDDGEALADWAARVAVGVSRAGARSAIVAGDEGAQKHLSEALALVGVKVEARVEAPGWFATLLKRA